MCHVVRLKRNKEVLESLLDSKHLLQYRFNCDEVLFAYERMESDALEWSEVGQVRAERQQTTCISVSTERARAFQRTLTNPTLAKPNTLCLALHTCAEKLGEWTACDDFGRQPRRLHVPERRLRRLTLPARVVRADEGAVRVRRSGVTPAGYICLNASSIAFH